MNAVNAQNLTLPSGLAKIGEELNQLLARWAAVTVALGVEYEIAVVYCAISDVSIGLLAVSKSGSPTW